ncbi:MAG: DedA family protein [Phycisphaerales bacterium]|nr:DedA family protein [Phycisphaerales bacterium]
MFDVLVKGLLVKFTYFALMFVLLIAGMGVPIPEDIPLLFSGYLCNPEHSPIIDLHTDRDVPDLYLMIASGMIGVLMGDSIVFYIGRRGVHGNNFVAKHIRKVLMNSKRREKVEHHFSKHGNLTVFCGRFMPGFRSLVFAFAGMSKMSYTRFLVIDGFAAAISVPVFVWLGYHFASSFTELGRFLARTKLIAVPVIITIVVGIVVIYYLIKRRAAANEKQEIMTNDE